MTQEDVQDEYIYACSKNSLRVFFNNSNTVATGYNDF